AAEYARNQQEIRAAAALVNDVITNADRLVYLCQQALFGIVYRGLNVDTIGSAAPDDSQAWESFRAAIIDWNSAKLTRLSGLKAHFDAGLTNHFLTLTWQIELLENMLEATYFKRRTSIYFIEDTGRIPGSFCPGKSGYLVELFGITPTL